MKNSSFSFKFLSVRVAFRFKNGRSSSLWRFDINITSKIIYRPEVLNFQIQYLILLCSDLRQVPDNQEVFVDKEGEGSIIIELLETPSSDIEFEQGIK